MNRLMKYIKDYKVRAVLAPLFKCLEACFELFVPLVISHMIDNGIRQGNTTYVIHMGMLLLLLAIIGLVCSITAQYFAAKVAIHTGKGLRNDLFKKINSLSYHEIDTLGTSSLITRMTSDINMVESNVNMVLRLFMRSPFIVFGAMIMSFTVSAKAGVTFLITIPLLSIVVFGIMFMTTPLYKKVQQILDRVMKSTRENLLGVRVVRAFNRQNSEMETFDQENGVLTAAQIHVGKIAALLNPVTYVIINLSVVYLIYKGARLVDVGELTQGQVVALVNYMSQILVELIKLANLIITLSRGFACLGRINDIFDIEPSIKTVSKSEVDADTNATAGAGIDVAATTAADATATVSADANVSAINSDSAVRFDHVTFNYTEGSESALSDIDFDVKKGETIGIIGGTGVGKSTLINLIPRFYDATVGTVSVFGKNVKEYTNDDLRGRIGIVPQHAVLFSGTLRSNMCWGKKDATDDEINEALKTAQAYDFVKSKGDGLDLEIEQEGRNLSGGQKQRLTIARALVRKPEILILDDSASALDFQTDAALRQAIHKEYSRESGKTAFIISQRVSTVRGSDRIIVLDDGNMAGIGTHEQLYMDCDVYREICLSQLSKDELEEVSHV